MIIISIIISISIIIIIIVIFDIFFIVVIIVVVVIIINTTIIIIILIQFQDHNYEPLKRSLSMAGLFGVAQDHSRGLFKSNHQSYSVRAGLSCHVTSSDNSPARSNLSKLF
jgi:hypothetical protein